MAETDVEQLVLSAVSASGYIEDTWTFSIQHNLDHQVIPFDHLNLKSRFNVIKIRT